MTELNEDEKRFVDSVRDVVTEFLETRTEEDIDNGVGAFVLSESGSVYHGVPVGAARWTHGEENAIGSMVTQEGVTSRVKMILILEVMRTYACLAGSAGPGYTNSATKILQFWPGIRG